MNLYLFDITSTEARFINTNIQHDARPFLNTCYCRTDPKEREPLHETERCTTKGSERGTGVSWHVETHRLPFILVPVWRIIKINASGRRLTRALVICIEPTLLFVFKNTWINIERHSHSFISPSTNEYNLHGDWNHKVTPSTTLGRLIRRKTLHTRGGGERI